MPLSPNLFLAAEVNPLGHVVDKELGAGLTLHTVTLVISGLLTIGVMMLVARHMKAEGQGAQKYLPKSRLASAFETVCVFIRDEVTRPQLGDATDRFIPYIWTLFFFILFNNLLGLVPFLDLQHLIGGVGWGDTHFAVFGGTATGNIAVTAALAIVAFFVIQINGIRRSGLGGWAHHFLGGAPVYLAPIMVPVEILGLIIKPSALAVRLFANMTAGHTLLATIMAFTGLGIAGLVTSPISLAAGIAVYFLEIFVAFLQAFVFMFLTIIFIAQLMHHEHGEHEGAHDYDHDQVSEIEDRAVPVSM